MKPVLFFRNTTTVVRTSKYVRLLLYGRTHWLVHGAECAYQISEDTINTSADSMKHIELLILNCCII